MIVLDRLRIPKRSKACHPSVNSLIKEFFALAWKHRTSLLDIEERAGIGASTITHWKTSRKPHLENFRAALNVIGYDLKIVRLRDESEAA